MSWSNDAETSVMHVFLQGLDLGTDGDWGGVLAEMHVDSDAGGQKRSREEAIIATSLRGIKGSAREEVLTLFNK